MFGNFVIVFEYSYFSDANNIEMKHFTAHDKFEFNALLNELPELDHELKSKDRASDALYMYLMKLRTGYTYQDIAFHFGVSKCTVLRRCNLVRSYLTKNIVPRYVNLELDRAELLNQKSATSRILFNYNDSDNAHIILDGTYIYLEKSSNHRFQKDSYNSHKKRNYLKIMMGVLTNGRILFTLGPFKATENDASITDKIFNASTPSIKAFMTGDIFILDRGFRDCVTDLTNLGFIVKMPTCSQKSQLTTEEANESRLVTKVRFEVERMNGIMKSVWKIFSTDVDVHYIPKIMGDFEIGAALLNRKLAVTDDSEKSAAQAKQMIHRLNLKNDLSRIVESKTFEKHIKEKNYELFVDFQSCPKLTIPDLEMISLGPYQVFQARRYISTHLFENVENFDIYHISHANIQNLFTDIINPDVDPLLLTISLKSRFVSNRTYRVYVLFDKNESSHRSILHYCCTCKVGKRTVGCCSHIMALIYFVSNASEHGVREVSKHLKRVFENNNWENHAEEYEEEEEEGENENSENDDIFIQNS